MAAAVHVKRDGLKREIEFQASRIHLDAPIEVRAEDFKKIAAEYVARFSRLFARLEVELDEIRAMDITEITVARAYADILDRQATTAMLVTKMMDAAAKLGLGEDAPPDPQEAIRQLMGSLAESRARAELL